jgi:hypothetical protein
MESTIRTRGAAVVSVPAPAVQPAAWQIAVTGVAGVAAASRLRGAITLHCVGIGMLRGQPALGNGSSGNGAPAPVAAMASAAIARISKVNRKATKQFRSTVYDGPRPWKVPV